MYFANFARKINMIICKNTWKTFDNSAHFKRIGGFAHLCRSSDVKM